MAKLKDSQDKLKILMENPNFPDIKRKVFPVVNLNISQISSDKAQVLKKVSNIFLFFIDLFIY